ARVAVRNACASGWGAAPGLSRNAFCISIWSPHWLGSPLGSGSCGRHDVVRRLGRAADGTAPRRQAALRGQVPSAGPGPDRGRTLEGDGCRRPARGRAVGRAGAGRGAPADGERHAGRLGTGRPGSGRERPVAVPSEPRAEDPDGYPAGHAGMRAAAVVGMFTALADRLAPPPRPPRRVAVPDVRGLFMGPCLHAVARAGLRIETVRLTEHPLPVEGLAVGQAPAPGTTGRPLSTPTVP